MENVKNTNISLSTILFVVFLVLKLCGTIDWSWWWVTAPLWIPFGLALLIITIGILVFGAAGFRALIK